MSTIAATLSGCGQTIEIGGLRIGLPGPEEGTTLPVSDHGPVGLAEARTAALDRLIEGLADPTLEPAGDVVLRLSLTGGWDLPLQRELHLSLEDDGRVVRVTDTSVFSSTDDYTSLRLRPAGIARVLKTVRPLLDTSREDLDGGAGVSPTDRSAWLEVGPEIVLSMDRLGQTGGYDAEQQARRAAFAAVIEGIDDLSWLGDDIAVAEEPWVPDSMTVLAAPRGGGGATGLGAVRWPLEPGIAELAQGTEVGPSGEARHVVCLSGDDVAPVFGLLSGVNHAHLAIDDGAPWELDVRPHYPGYRLFGDPCQS